MSVKGASPMVKVSVAQTGFHIDPVHWDMNLTALFLPRKPWASCFKTHSWAEAFEVRVEGKADCLYRPNFSTHPGLVLFLACLQEPGKWDILWDQGPNVFSSAFLAAAVSMASSPWKWGSPEVWSWEEQSLRLCYQFFLRSSSSWVNHGWFWVVPWAVVFPPSWVGRLSAHCPFLLLAQGFDCSSQPPHLATRNVSPWNFD